MRDELHTGCGRSRRCRQPVSAGFPHRNDYCLCRYTAAFDTFGAVPRLGDDDEHRAFVVGVERQRRGERLRLVSRRFGGRFDVVDECDVLWAHVRDIVRLGCGRFRCGGKPIAAGIGDGYDGCVSISAWNGQPVGRHERRNLRAFRDARRL